MPTLGQPRWGATIAEPSGRIIWQSGEDISDWDFDRVLCDISKASIKIAASPVLCSRVEPWLHTLTFWAGSEVAWHGLVTETKAAKGSLTVTASDGACLFKRRRLPSGRFWDQRDASQVMQQLVVDGMGPSDPLHIADHIHALDSRIWVVVNETANSVLVDDVVDDLTEVGLEWTFVGGSLMVGPVGARHRTAPLSDRHLGDDVVVTKVGKDVVTDVLVKGEGVWAQRAIEDDRIVLQSIVKGNKLATVQECETKAQATLDQFAVAPVAVSVGGAGLRADAPVSLHELVPGVRVPVSSVQTGVRVGCDLMIEKVAYSPDGIKLTHVPPSVSWEAREEFPPPLTNDFKSPWEKEQAGKANASQKDKADDADWVKPGTPL
ncbi:hypothetical protein [Ligilactobacillus salivarius]|uniref:hypothetical protein n=1 Tax=Ligilactobacillus salivarius TaxID=1624 RepID=UPI003F8A2DCE